MTVADASTVAAPPARTGVRLRRRAALAIDQRLASAAVRASAPAATITRCVQSTASAIDASGQTANALVGGVFGTQKSSHRTWSGINATRNGASSDRSQRDDSRPSGTESRNQTKKISQTRATQTPIVASSGDDTYCSSGPTSTAKPVPTMSRPSRASGPARHAIRPLAMNDHATTTARKFSSVRPPTVSSRAMRRRSSTPPAAPKPATGSHHRSTMRRSCSAW
jgi:hypothetical protein